MTTLAIEARAVAAERVEVTDESLMVDLDDGRTISVPQRSDASGVRVMKRVCFEAHRYASGR
jgi:outer membrane lipoprotein SlyB